jgi:thiol-disulfide isomerase/thioredoxin
MNPILKVVLKVAIVPAVVVAYVTISGLTGFCPACTSIMNCVLWRDDVGAVDPAGAPVGGSVLGLTAYSLDGQPVALSTLKQAGKPMLIEVWATWCGPCREQRKINEAMGEELSSRATVVSMSVDKDPRVVEEFLKSTHRSDAELMASPEALNAFGGVTAIPTLVFVDSGGNIRGVTTGTMSAGELKKKVEGL